MPAWLNRIVILGLFLAALSGWSLAAYVGLRALPPAAAADATITARTEAFVQARILAEAEGGRFERVTQYTTGALRTVVEAEAAATAGSAITGLAYGSGSFTVLLRAGDQALVEGRYEVTKDGGKTKVSLVEHYLLRVAGTGATTAAWNVEAMWRLDPGTGGPLIAPLAITSGVRPDLNSLPGATLKPERPPATAAP